VIRGCKANGIFKLLTGACGGNMSGVENLRERTCPGWENDWREYIRVSKMREFVRDSSSNGLKLEIRLTFVGFFATGKHSIIQQWVLADIHVLFGFGLFSPIKICVNILCYNINNDFYCMFLFEL